MTPREAKGNPKEHQKQPKGRPTAGLGDSREALGQPGATSPKTEEGNRVFRLKNGPDFGGPGVDFSVIFASNFRNDFSLIFDAVFVAKLPSKSQPKGGQGRQMPGQSLP